jgi:hypothetical protein
MRPQLVGEATIVPRARLDLRELSTSVRRALGRRARALRSVKKIGDVPCESLPRQSAFEVSVAKTGAEKNSQILIARRA